MKMLGVPIRTTKINAKNLKYPEKSRKYIIEENFEVKGLRRTNWQL